MRKLLLASLLALVASSPAYASLVFTIGADGNFSSTSGSTGPFTGPFGFVKLTDGTGTSGNGILLGTVHVDETLAPNVFANTGSADNLEFSIEGAPSQTSLTISNLLFSGPSGSTSAYSLDAPPSAPPTTNGLGGFQFGISCNTSKTTCGNGTSSPQMDKLSFDITNDTNNLKAIDFVVGDAAGYYFLSDIGIAGVNGNIIATGYSGAVCTTGCGGLDSGGGLPAPEPGSLALLGTAVAALGWVVRRKRC